MKLAGYIRVSTEGQVEAFGKEVQRKYISDWSEMNAIDGVATRIVEWFEEDGVSGKTDSGDRPALRNLLERADEFDGIVFFDATRLARRLLVQETLLNLIWTNGLRVFSATAGELVMDEDDPTKNLIRQILGVIAEFDHRTTVRKLQAGRMAKSAQGGYIGGTVPYGLQAIGSGKVAQLIADPVESEVVNEIVRRHGFGESMREIAASLNRREIPTKMGKQWTATQVSRVLARNQNA